MQAEILHNTLALQDLAAEGLAFRRGRRREAGWRIKHQEDSREILFETILKAFGSVLRTGEDEDGGAPAMQVLEEGGGGGGISRNPRLQLITGCGKCSSLLYATHSLLDEVR